MWRRALKRLKSVRFSPEGIYKHVSKNTQLQTSLFLVPQTCSSFSSVNFVLKLRAIAFLANIMKVVFMLFACLAVLHQAQCRSIEKELLDDLQGNNKEFYGVNINNIFSSISSIPVFLPFFVIFFL